MKDGEVLMAVIIIIGLIVSNLWMALIPFGVIGLVYLIKKAKP